MTDASPSSIHLIGIGGVGMSAIARVLIERGLPVSGSDKKLSALALELRQLGAQVYEGHAAENIASAGVVVRSSAVPDDNAEVQEARRRGIPVLKRSDFLGELLAGYETIAVAGSHGKTTTCAMIAWMLTALGLDPSYIIGGVSANLGNNAHSGGGRFFVIEADEYDYMFLGLQPQYAVVTNVEHDHPDCYPTPEDFRQAFLAFTGKLKPGGVLLACGDDPGSARLLREVKARSQQTRSYGLESMFYAYSAHDLRPNERGGYDAELAIRNTVMPLSLQTPGKHNVLNALAAISVADLLALPLRKAAQALGEYRGAGRRFELRGEAGGVTVIDDYAHHPSQIRATLAAARDRFPGRPLWAVWQPHTYSRTRALLEDYAAAFSDADHVLVTEVYAAREPEPADGFGALQVLAAMQHPDAHFTPKNSQAVTRLLDRLQPGDVLLVLSAGDGDVIGERVLEALKR